MLHHEKERKLLPNATGPALFKLSLSILMNSSMLTGKLGDKNIFLRIGKVPSPTEFPAYYFAAQKKINKTKLSPD